MKTKSLIVNLPDPILRQPSRKIGFIDQAIRDLNARMVQQAFLWEANRQDEVTVGLAAVQIGKPVKMIIVRQAADSENAKPSFLTLINPKITKASGKKNQELEGCLSIQDFYFNVERFENVKVSALDLQGQPLRFAASGFLARIIQHEIDHLKGITILDQAVPRTNEHGEKFSCCRLSQKGGLEVVTKKDIAHLTP